MSETTRTGMRSDVLLLGMRQRQAAARNLQKAGRQLAAVGDLGSAHQALVLARAVVDDMIQRVRLSSPVQQPTKEMLGFVEIGPMAPGIADAD